MREAIITFLENIQVSSIAKVKSNDLEILLQGGGIHMSTINNSFITSKKRVM